MIFLLSFMLFAMLEQKHPCSCLTSKNSSCSTVTASAAGGAVIPENSNTAAATDDTSAAELWCRRSGSRTDVRIQLQNVCDNLAVCASNMTIYHGRSFGGASKYETYTIRNGSPAGCKQHAHACPCLACVCMRGNFKSIKLVDAYTHTHNKITSDFRHLM